MQKLNRSELSGISGGQEIRADAINVMTAFDAQYGATGFEYELDPAIFAMTAHVMPDGTIVIWCGDPPADYGFLEGGCYIDPVVTEPIVNEFDANDLVIAYPFYSGGCP